MSLRSFLRYPADKESMEIEVHFTDQRIAVPASSLRGEAGAVVDFPGVGRDIEHGAKISALVCWRNL
ncbi:MAG: hypothetical protein ACOYM3_25775 [Terrimicrobiaceae bacterium]